MGLQRTANEAWEVLRAHHVPAVSHNPVGEQHAILLANCFAPAEALMRGMTTDEATVHDASTNALINEAKALAGFINPKGWFSQVVPRLWRAWPYFLGLIVDGMIST